MISSTASFPPSCRMRARVNSPYAFPALSLVSFLVSFGVSIVGFNVPFMVYDVSNMSETIGENPRMYAEKIKKAPSGADFQMVRETGVEPVPFRFFMLFFRLLVSFWDPLVYNTIVLDPRRG